MQYLLTLANGQKLENLTKNGGDYISQTKIDETIFKDNLSTLTISDGETETILNDVEFIGQQEWEDGFYFAFRELSAEEKLLKELRTTINKQNEEILTLQLALAETYETMLGGQ